MSSGRQRFSATSPDPTTDIAPHPVTGEIPVIYGFQQADASAADQTLIRGCLIAITDQQVSADGSLGSDKECRLPHGTGHRKIK